MFGPLPTCSCPHTCRVVRHICDRVAVMYLGKIVRRRHATPVQPPQHLSFAVSGCRPGPRRDAPDAASCSRATSRTAAPSLRCRFRTRCFKAKEICAMSTAADFFIRPDQHRQSCHANYDVARPGAACVSCVRRISARLNTAIRNSLHLKGSA